MPLCVYLCVYVDWTRAYARQGGQEEESGHAHGLFWSWILWHADVSFLALQHLSKPVMCCLLEICLSLCLMFWAGCLIQEWMWENYTSLVNSETWNIGLFIVQVSVFLTYFEDNFHYW